MVKICKEAFGQAITWNAKKSTDRKVQIKATKKGEARAYKATLECMRVYIDSRQSRVQVCTCERECSYMIESNAVTDFHLIVLRLLLPLR